MNCDIERRKSFDVNGDDFAYCDILQTRLEVGGPTTARQQRQVSQHLLCSRGLA